MFRRKHKKGKTTCSRRGNVRRQREPWRGSVFTSFGRSVSSIHDVPSTIFFIFHVFPASHTSPRFNTHPVPHPYSKLFLQVLTMVLYSWQILQREEGWGNYQAQNKAKCLKCFCNRLQLTWGKGGGGESWFFDLNLVPRNVRSVNVNSSNH